MIIALTGGTGFVGGAVIARLTEAGHEVRALARKPQAARDGVTWIAGALDTPDAMATLCAGANAVVHIAGVVNAPDAAGFDAGNRTGTVAMIDAALAAGVRRFVHVSSLAAREPGLSIYGASKRAGEDAVVASALDWVVVRPPGVYGPGDTEFRDMFRLAKRGLALLPPEGRISLIHVDDLARLLAMLATGGPSHAIYEVDDGRPGGWTHRDFADALGKAVGARGVVKLAMPKAVLGVAARIDKATRGNGAKLTADRVGYISHPDWVAHPDRHVPHEAWHAVIETQEGLKTTAQWYREKGWL